jgi:XapX domain-containing protein
VKPYILSLSVGLFVGIVYGLVNVRSPAPPVIALIGLLGIILGEQVVPIAKRAVESKEISISTIQENCGSHVFGRLPGKCGGSAGAQTKAQKS